MGDLAIYAAALAFGFVSAIFPLFNAEAYVVGLGGLVSGPGRLVVAILALTVGTVVGKALVFVLVRRGSQRFASDPEERRPPKTTFGARVRTAGDTMLAMMDRPVTGALTVLVSSLLAVPPLAIVSIVAALSNQRLWMFLAMVLLGRAVQYLAIAFVIHHVVS